jgi:hypothetical protein
VISSQDKPPLHLSYRPKLHMVIRRGVTPTILEGIADALVTWKSSNYLGTCAYSPLQCWWKEPVAGEPIATVKAGSAYPTGSACITSLYCPQTTASD